jgi:hypothetical protein
MCSQAVVIGVRRIIKTLKPLYENRARNSMDIHSYTESDTCRRTVRPLMPLANALYPTAQSRGFVLAETVFMFKLLCYAKQIPTSWKSKQLTHVRRTC